MRIRRTLQTGLAAGLLVSAAALAGPQNGDLAHFTALEQAWLGAIAAHDIKTLDQLLAPDFVDTAWNGQTRGKAEVLAAAGRPGPANGPQTLSEITVRRYGGTAVVRGLDSSARGAVRFTDVFVRRKGAWQAVGAQETPVR